MCRVFQFILAQNWQSVNDFYLSKKNPTQIKTWEFEVVYNPKSKHFFSNPLQAYFSYVFYFFLHLKLQRKQTEQTIRLFRPNLV